MNIMGNPKEQGGNENSDSLAAEVPFDPPARERTWADHDEPWQYQPYHLKDEVKRTLIKKRGGMLGGEFGAGEESVAIIDFQDPEYMQKAPRKDHSEEEEHHQKVVKPETHDIPLGFYRSDFGFHDDRAGDHNVEWKNNPDSLGFREKLNLLRIQKTIPEEEHVPDTDTTIADYLDPDYLVKYQEEQLVRQQKDPSENIGENHTRPQIPITVLPGGAHDSTSSDHDEPWQYRSYHLTDWEKVDLLRRREKILAGEFVVDEKAEEVRDFNDPDYRKKAEEELKRSVLDRVNEMLLSTSSSEVQIPETFLDGIKNPYQPRPVSSNTLEDQAA